MLSFLHSTGAIIGLFLYWDRLLLVPDGGRWGTTTIQVLIATSHAPGDLWAISLESFRAVWGSVSDYLALRWPFLALADISEATKLDKTQQ